MDKKEKGLDVKYEPNNLDDIRKAHLLQELQDIQDTFLDVGMWLFLGLCVSIALGYVLLGV